MSLFVIWSIVADVIGIILAAVFGLIARHNWEKNHTPQFAERIFMDEPTDKGLALGALAYWGEKETADMRAHILAGIFVEMADAKILELDVAGNEIRLNDSYNAPFTDIQRATLGFLFHGGRKVSLRRLFSQHPLDIARDYDDWFSRIRELAQREEIFVDRTKNWSGSFLWPFLYQIVVFIVFMVYSAQHRYDSDTMAFESIMNFFNFATIILQVFMYNFCSGRLDKLSPEAVEIRARAEALKEWLSQVPAAIEDARRWDKMFPWAVALGVPVKIFRKVRLSWQNVYTRDDEFSVAMDIEDVVARALKEKDKATGRKEAGGTEYYQRGM